MNSAELLEIAKQLQELNKQKQVENYLKLYDITKDSKILEHVSYLMGYQKTKSEQENQIDKLFKY